MWTADRLTDDETVGIGEAASEYKRYLNRVGDKERAKALGLGEKFSPIDLRLAHAAAVDTLVREFMVARAVIEGKRAIRDGLIGYSLNAGSAVAAGMNAARLALLLDAYSNLRPDQVASGLFKTRKGYVVGCDSRGLCVAVTPRRLVISRP